MFARRRQRLGAPGIGHRVDVQIGQAGFEQALGTQFGQAGIQAAGDAAEIGVTGIAQAEHRVAQFRQLGRAPAGQELDQADGIVRRIAFALGADDHVQQAFAGQFAGRIGVRPQQAHRQPGRLDGLGDLLGRASRIAGLAAVDHGQALARLRLAARQHRQLGHVLALGEPGRIAGQPPQGRRIQPFDQPRQQHTPLLGQGTGRQCGGGSGHRGQSLCAGGSPMLGTRCPVQKGRLVMGLSRWLISRRGGGMECSLASWGRSNGGSWYALRRHPVTHRSPF